LHDHFIKTHSLNGAHQGLATINRAETQGARFIPRNPLDLASSYVARFAMTVDQTIDASIGISPCSSAGAIMCDRGGTPRVSPRMVRYEDLLEQPALAFRRVLEALGLAIAPGRLERAARFSSFSELSGQERRGGFSERLPIAGASSAKVSRGRSLRPLDDHRLS
jgi:hypothetical protein